jgi:hypothetical protein
MSGTPAAPLAARHIAIAQAKQCGAGGLLLLLLPLLWQRAEAGRRAPVNSSRCKQGTRAHGRAGGQAAGGRGQGADAGRRPVPTFWTLRGPKPKKPARRAGDTSSSPPPSSCCCCCCCCCCWAAALKLRVPNMLKPVPCASMRGAWWTWGPGAAWPHLWCCWASRGACGARELALRLARAAARQRRLPCWQARPPRPPWLPAAAAAAAGGASQTWGAPWQVPVRKGRGKRAFCS